MSAPPPWLQADISTESQEDVVTPLRPNGVSIATEDAVDPIKLSCGNISEIPRKQSIFWMFKIATIALSLLMILTAFIGLLELSGIEEMGRIFVATYMIFFSGLLMTFEISQVRPCKFSSEISYLHFSFNIT